ncbi:MAG: pilus assembly PilX N-terminal domain-containing protein [Candidatus Scalindua sediminis]
MDSKRQSKTLSAIPTNANEKGIVLVGAIALVAILALLGTVGVVTTSTEIIISKNYKTSVQARYVAEAGIHRTIGMLNSDPGWIEGINPTINAFSGDDSFGNGTYDVKVYKDEPIPGKVRILTTGDVNGSSSTFEAIVSPQSYKILDYATFDCGDIVLKVSENNVISGDVFVNGNLDLEASGIQQIQGDVYATGDIIVGGVSSITGNAFANGDIKVQSSASPNIEGNATMAGVLFGSGTVSGTTSQGVSPDPVINLCDPAYLAGITVTSDVIQDFRVNADYTFANYEYDTSDNFTGIVHISGDFELTANSTYSDDVIFIVDGNVDITGSLTKHVSAPAGSSVIFLVPTGNFKVKGGGNVVIEGTVLVGTVDSDGSNPIGGSVDVTEDSNLTINGRVIAVNGNTDAAFGGTFVVNYPSSDDNDLISSGSYAMMQWREVRN